MINRVISLYPSAVFTTTQTGTAMASSIGPALSVAAPVTKHSPLAMQVFVEVTTITSTQAQIDISIQGQHTASGTWFTLQPLVGDASLAWVAVNNTTTTQVRRFMGPIPLNIRAVLTTSGTSPNYTAAVTAVVGE